MHCVVQTSDGSTKAVMNNAETANFTLLTDVCARVLDW
jgi:hypothetical protein